MTATSLTSLNSQITLLTGATRGELVSHSGGRNRARGPVMFGILVIAATFLGGGLWAARTPISSAAMAPGTVTVASGLQVIQHLEEGLVKQILVRDGDNVKAGQVLVRLDGTRAQADVALLRGQVDLSEATAARLLAEQAGLKSMAFPPDLLTRADNDPEVPLEMAAQVKLFDSRAAVLEGQKSILNQQVAEYQQQIKGFQAIVAAKGGQSDLIKVELNDLSGLLAKGLVQKTRVLALQREELQLGGDRGQAIADIARAEQGIGEATRQIYQLDKQRQDEDAKDLLQVQEQLNEQRQKLVAATDVVNRLNIVAPTDGAVFNLAVHTIGAVISPNTVLMEIVPRDGSLIVDAEVNPMDIDSIHVGDQVSLRVMAANTRLTPTIQGRLDEVSADRVSGGPSTPGAAPGPSFFKARISIPAEEAKRLAPIQLHVGMAVEAMIDRGSQTVLYYALKPLLDSLSHSFREQ